LGQCSTRRSASYCQTSCKTANTRTLRGERVREARRYTTLPIGNPGSMASWRDSASQQAQDDLDGLLNAVLPFAEQTISKYGGMYPFGAAVTANGELKMLAADPGPGDRPASQDVLTGLYTGA